MYKCERLSKKNFNQFLTMNKYRYTFNELNADFLEYYCNSNIAERIFSKKLVKLIKRDNEYIGFIWYNKEDKNLYNIKSMYIEDNHTAPIRNFLFKFKKDTRFVYECKSNDFNYYILMNIGFTKKQGTLELYKYIENPYEDIEKGEYCFESFRKGEQEDIRCKLQNDIFKSNSRIPLTVEDIIYDENQDYYIEDCSVFLKYGEKYIGYAQIIMDEGHPTIVNFGLISQYRGKGFSKLLIKKILNMGLERGYKSIKIKVSSDNVKAINLYEKVGFKIFNEFYNWELLISKNL